MKRLFKIKVSGSYQYFDSKMAAKAVRDLDLHSESHVSRGPDHIGKHGVFSKKRHNKA